eukprot:TRINITY_DN12728_c0_g3_i2.p1 TRINITY_DN12728_c0_g3~~TRINITY_DN12728_c0_g3_i2.p1  ORF type:complete len:323 (-),score=49.76 TRINITY_DN12728_c0_g3_i2:498-1466(-)
MIDALTQQRLFSPKPPRKPQKKPQRKAKHRRKRDHRVTLVHVPNQVTLPNPGHTCFVNAALQIFKLLFVLLDEKLCEKSVMLKLIYATYRQQDDRNWNEYRKMLENFQTQFVHINWTRPGDTNVFLKSLLKEVVPGVETSDRTIGKFQQHTCLTIDAAKKCASCGCKVTVPKHAVFPIDELSRQKPLADGVAKALYYMVTCIGCGEVLQREDGSAALVHLPQFLLLEIPEAEWELDLVANVSVGAVEYEWVGFSMANSVHVVAVIREDDGSWYEYNDGRIVKQTSNEILRDARHQFRRRYPLILTAICKIKNPITVEATQLL